MLSDMSIKQGESIIVGGKLFEDDGTVITDYSHLKISFLISNPQGEPYLKYTSGTVADPKIIRFIPYADGSFEFRIEPQQTKQMAGFYTMSIKVTGNEGTAVSTQDIVLKMIGSKIGQDTSL